MLEENSMKDDWFYNSIMDSHKKHQRIFSFFFTYVLTALAFEMPPPLWKSKCQMEPWGLASLDDVMYKVDNQTICEHWPLFGNNNDGSDLVDLLVAHALYIW